MPSPFLILALPRSRTCWLSRFLSYAPWSCGHEEARHLRSSTDIKAWLSQECTGSAETAVARWWRLIPRLCPQMKVVVIRRPVAEVVDSLMRLDLGFDRSRLLPIIEKYDRALDRVERKLSPLSLRFSDLENEGACRRVFEYCLSLPHDHDWWARWAPEHVECDMRGILRHARAFGPQMALMGRLLTRELRRGRGDPDKPRIVVSGDDGIDICRESLDRLWADGGLLFAEHCRAVGEADDEYQRKNLPMLWRLEAAGAMHIVTARCNGRLLAYLFSFLAESPEHVGLLTATQTLFFSCDDAPAGLGLRLQRASIADLRARGVGEVYMRAGVRGAGPKLGVLYRRLGAQEYGSFWKLSLNDIGGPA